MGQSGKIAILCLGALCAAITATPLRGQERPVSKALLDSIANPATAKGADAMRFEKAHIDAGRIGEDDAPSEYIYRWHNEGDKPLVISRVQTTCGCASPSYGKEPVRPGGEGSVTITYHPKGHPGSFQRKIFVFTQLSDKQPTAVLELTGHVSGSIMPTGDYPYAMGGLLLKQQRVRISGNRLQTERIECLNASGKPLRIRADDRLLPAYVAFACDPQTIQPGKTADLVIRFDPAKAPEALPTQIPILLEGVDLPPSQRTIRIRIGEKK